MTTSSKIIAKQNDMFRQNLGKLILKVQKVKGKYVTSSGFKELTVENQLEARDKIRGFNDFNEDNDPHGEHDYGRFQLENNKQDIIWKIDYYDTNYEYGSEDPSDLSKTRRVLTVMLACEY
ncbi:DUF3768 domain-containing protein [Flavivirga abyssicola]|uniref:DUF3768 domain-containing protein n=1 Tax=Flavivirga abyssicola TaxID=3063533 RepID=UPI0026DF137F|nr:DUF3768 domain-containing protein [Flavivirga sp. MEBiC07777]WVK15088.1 DUF3768 domain-containing protein [Flavivirga sp. MEBiC07777]